MALFVSLGGASYAATSLPKNSVGQQQLRKGAVTYQKIRPNSVGKVRLANGGVIHSKLAHNAVGYKNIQPNAVGHVRANLDQLQARVGGICKAGGAVGTIDSDGNVQCNPTVPGEYGAINHTAPVGLGPSLITSKALPAGSSYLAIANPVVSVTSAAKAQRVAVTCTLTMGPAPGQAPVTEIQSAVIATTGTPGQISTASIPLQAPGAAGTSKVQCQAKADTGTLPKMNATAAISAVQTAYSK